MGRLSNVEKTERVKEDLIEPVTELLSRPAMAEVKEKIEKIEEGPFSVLIDGYLKDLKDALDLLKPGEIVDRIVAFTGTKRGFRGKSRFLILGERENSTAITRYIYATGFDDFSAQVSQMTKGEKIVAHLDEPMNNKVRVNVNRYYLAVIVKR